MAEGKDASALAQSLTEFGLNLHRTLVGADPNANVFFSPASISLVMSMTYAGCRGNTEKELAQALKLDKFGPEEVHPLFAGLVEEVFSGGKPYTLNTANRMYARLGRKFRGEYIDVATTHYKAEPLLADFASKPEQVRGEINSWVADQTMGKIKDLIKPGSINPMTAMVLVNAIYFKGNWARQFDPKLTHPDTFNCLDGSKVDVQMMKQKAKFGFGYIRDYDTQVLSMPYVGDSLSLVVFLPLKEGGLKALEAGLSHDLIADTMSHLAREEVTVYMPKFKLEYSSDLNEALQALGVKDLFVEGACDLSGVDGTRDLSVSKVVHKAFIEVNEEGSEAAAATAAIMMLRCMPMQLDFRADKPFLFMIRHTSGSVLFQGRMAKPEVA